MKIKLIIALAWIAVNMLYSCHAQIINNDMERYDFATMNNSKVNTVGIQRNGWTILMHKMTSTGAWYNEYPPVPEFYSIVKNFHSNGMLKSKGKYIGQHLMIGIWQYYDEQGHLIKEVDEDSKFGKIKLIWILKFLEKEGYINLTTGKGREYGVIDDNFSYTIPCRFFLGLEEKDKPFWLIIIDPAQWNNHVRTVYHIDKDSGEVLYKKTEQVRFRK